MSSGGGGGTSNGAGGRSSVLNGQGNPLLWTGSACCSCSFWLSDSSLLGPVAADRPYEQHNIPGYREIIDLSPANDSRFIDAVGESGHFLSPHYDDFLTDWQAVRQKKMRMLRTDIENGAIGRLRLTP